MEEDQRAQMQLLEALASVLVQHGLAAHLQHLLYRLYFDPAEANDGNVGLIGEAAIVAWAETVAAAAVREHAQPFVNWLK